MMTLAKCKQTQLQQTRYTVPQNDTSRDSFAGLFQLGIISWSKVLWFLGPGQMGLCDMQDLKKAIKITCVDSSTVQFFLNWQFRTELSVCCRKPSTWKAKKTRDICIPKTQSPVTLWLLDESHSFFKVNITMTQAPISSVKPTDKRDPKNRSSTREDLRGKGAWYL